MKTTYPYIARYCIWVTTACSHFQFIYIYSNIPAISEDHKIWFMTVIRFRKDDSNLYNFYEVLNA